MYVCRVNHGQLLKVSIDQSVDIIWLLRQPINYYRSNCYSCATGMMHKLKPSTAHLLVSDFSLGEVLPQLGTELYELALESSGKGF